MPVNTHQSFVLSEILLQCGVSNALRPEELEAIYQYLFDVKDCLPFVRNKVLHETIFYLSELIREQEINTLAGLTSYFDQKKHTLKTFLHEMMREGA